MLTAADFEPEPLPPDSIPHAFERLVGHLCREAGLYVGKSSVVSEHKLTPGVTSGEAAKVSA